MTLYAPHSRGQTLALIARRALLSRHFILTGTATFAMAMLMSGASEKGFASFTQFETPKTESGSAAEESETLAGTSGWTTTRMAASDEPKTAQVARETGDWTDLAAEAQQEPAHAAKVPAMRLRYAALAPTSEAMKELSELLSLRFPETAPVAIVPSRLPDISARDEQPELNRETYQENETVRIERVSEAVGQELDDVLNDLGVRADDIRATMVALRADNIPSLLSEGDVLDLATEDLGLGNTERRLLAVRLNLKSGREVELRWDGEVHNLWAEIDDRHQDSTEKGFEPVSIVEALGEKALFHGETDKVYLRGEVRSSLFEAAAEAGMTPGEAETLAEIFRYMIDFERDLRTGDWFEVLFEKKPNGDYGDILYAMIQNRGTSKVLYRAQTPDGDFEYFDAEGKTNKRSLMRTPVAYARISSKYGMRRHPIQGYRKMHRGVDFAAPTGTPILAAGDGTVEYVGQRGSYGKYIRIRHRNGYKTAYAHMSRYAKSMSKGTRVKQGDVIGYVGSTGRSTGPHLHFEVIQNGERINPMSIADFGPLRGLEGRSFANFKARAARLDLVLSELRPTTRVAQADE